MKRCNKCGVNQEEKEYLPNYSTKDGKSKDCISCRAKKKDMSYQEFIWWYLSKSQKHDYYIRHREEQVQYSREYQQNNPEKKVQHSKKFYLENKDYYLHLARKQRHLREELDYQWTPEMEQVIRELFPCCVVCGKTEEQNLLEENKRLHVDHVLPLSKGSGLFPGNAVVLCGKCNRAKSDKDLEELMEDVREKIKLSARKFEELWESRF